MIELIVVCAGSVFFVGLLVWVMIKRDKQNDRYRTGYPNDFVRPSSTSTQTRKQANKTTTLNTYPQTASTRTQDDSSDDMIASALVAAAFMDSPPPAANSETIERAADYSDSSDTSTHDSSGSSYSGGSSYDGGGYDSGGGFDSGGGDGGGGGGGD